MFSSCLQVENVSMEGSKPVFSTRKAKTADSFAQERNGVKKEFKLHDPGRGKECKRTTYGVLLISVICKHDHVYVLLYCLCANVHTHHYSYSFICYVVCMIISVCIDIFADTSKLLYVHIQFEFTFRTVSILLIGLQYYY